jgi:hypothetical protein
MNYYAPIIRSSSYNVTVYKDTYTATDDTTLNNIVFFKNGVTINSGKTLTINTPARMAGTLDIDSGYLKLGGDLIFGSDVTLPSSHVENFDCQGKTIHLSGPLTIPGSTQIYVTSDGIIDGHGNMLTLGGSNAQLYVNASKTLTLRNLILKGLAYDGSPRLTAHPLGSICLENVTLDLSNDFLFTTGKIFISGDVIVKGPHAFSYMSYYPLTIQSGSTLYFDLGTTFTYHPANMSDLDWRTHLVEKNVLLRMADATSTLYFNGATFNVPAAGISLIKGRLVLDNKVTFNNYTDNYWTTPNTDVNSAITLGDGALSTNDLTISVLAGARLKVNGYLNYNNIS